MKRATWHLALVSGACLIAGCGLGTSRDDEAQPFVHGGQAGPPTRDWAAAIQPLRLYLPLNYLGGAPWMVDVFSARDAKKALEKEYVFHAEWEGQFPSHNLRTFCYEIVRATGKRLVWIADPEVDYLKEYGNYGMIDSPLEWGWGPGRQTEYGRVCRRSLGCVLQCLVTRLTGLAQPEGDAPASVWTAWVGRDRIYLVRLPQAQPPEAPSETPPAGESKAAPQVAYKAVDALSPSESDDYVNYYFDTEVVLPSGGEDTAVLRAAIPPLSAQEALLRRACRVGDRTGWGHRDLPLWLAHGTGMPLTWYPAPPEAEKGAAKGTQPQNVGKDQPDTSPESGTPPTASAAQLMWRIIGDATEYGLTRQEPDREVWVSLITEKGFVFLLLPSLYW